MYKKANEKHIVIILILLFLIIQPSINVFAQEYYSEDMEAVEEYSKPVRAKVLNVMTDEEKRIETSGEDLVIRIQYVEILITEGKHKDRVINVENYIDAYNMVVEEGYMVQVFIEEDFEGNLINAYIVEIIRDKYMYYLVAIFVLSMLIIGGLKGLKAIITLALTGLAVMKILLPLVLRGYNPVLLSVGICIIVITFTLIIVSGINKKTLAAIIGTGGGVLIAGIIALSMGTMAKLTGMGNDEAQFLLYIPQAIDFDFRGLLFAGIILGSLGAVMDVSMSVASSMHEIKEASPDIKTTRLICAGMNVGRDIMGTMSNTLILAYAGGSLHLMLLFLAYEVPFAEIINRDIIASEILRALAGSIGLIFSIPITSLSAALLQKKKNT